MKNKASFLFAYRMLFPKTGKKSNARKSLVASFLCIAISLVPLVMILTVSDGMIKGMTERMIGLSSSHLCCIFHPDIEEVSSEESLIEMGETLMVADGVKAFYPELQSVGLASTQKIRTGAQIRAVRNDIFQVNPHFGELFEIVESENNIKSVKELYLEDSKNAVIGKKLAEILNLHAGDELRLITTKILSKGRVIPKITKFRVSAVVSSGYQELDTLWFFISLKTGYDILPLRSSQIMIGLETEDAFSLELNRIRGEIEQFVPSFTRIYKWNELNSAQFENFSSTQMMLTFIMILILLVASVNISSALIMLVMERKKEIAILKSLGATSSSVSLSFLITGFVTGFLGIITGLPAGLFCAVNFNSIIKLIEKLLFFFKKIAFALQGKSFLYLEEINLLDPAYYLQNINVSLPLDKLILISGGTLALSLIASVIPAIKAGKEKPIETLCKGNL